MTSHDEQNQSVWSREQVTVSPIGLKRRVTDLLKSPYRQSRDHLYVSNEPSEVLESDLCLFGFATALFLWMVFASLFVGFLFPVVGGLAVILATFWFGFLLIGLRGNSNHSSLENRLRTAGEKRTK